MEEMTRFGASLRFAELSAVVQLLGELASTGRLRLIAGDWTGEVVVRRGVIVGASLADEHAFAALDGIAIGFVDGDLTFADGPVAEDATPLVDDQSAYLKRLSAERQRIHTVVGSLQLVPRLVESAESQVTVNAAALHVVPQLIFGHTLEDIARRRGLARTLREIAVLVRAGAVSLSAKTEPEATAGGLSRDPDCRLPG